MNPCPGTPRGSLRGTLILLALASFAACTCQAPPPAVCGSDEECPGGSCVNGACVTCPPCQSGERCVAGACVADTCGDTVCGSGEVCIDGQCREPSCASITCAPDEQCVRGQCYPGACGGVLCRPGEVCYEGACTSPSCVGVLCAEGEVCADGRCLPQSCMGVLCAQGAACDDGKCVDVRCVGVTCPAGTLCSAGECKPTDCGGVACAAGEVCESGQCEKVGCTGLSCPAGTQCESSQCVPCPGGICCHPSDPPIPCGESGSSCTQTCRSDGSLGACQPPSGPVDTTTDPSHCGRCGKVCPTPVHAAARCMSGTCGRGPCEPGYFDLDGPLTFGCEAQCTATECRDANGNPIPIDAIPPPETGVIWHAFSSGASVGAEVQTNATHINYGVLGEAVVGEDGAEMSNGTHRSRGGFVTGVW